MFDWLFDWTAKLNAYILGLLPDWIGNGFSQLADAMGPGAQYLAYLLGLDIVIPLMVTAYILRFTIRRIPIVG